MATDATGTPTSPDGIPTYNTSVDAPSGNGFNAAMAFIQTIITELKAGTLPSGKLAIAALTGYPADATKVLLGDGTWATGASIGATLPVGMTVEYPVAAAPTGWVLCDGASYLRTAPYDLLFGLIGTTYGSADGTHFNVPDHRGRVAVGYAASGGHADVSTMGATEGVTLASRRSTHQTSSTNLSVTGSPGLSDPGHSHTISVGTAPNPGVAGIIGMTDHAVFTSLSTDGASTGITVNVGSLDVGGSGGPSGTAPIDTPAYIVTNKIIKL